MLRATFALILGLSLLIGGVAAASAAHPAQTGPEQYTLPGNAVYPEGIAYDRETRSFYVGSSTDGTIYHGLLSDPTATIFSPGGADGRTSVTGMKVDTRGRLFVSGAGTGLLFVYDTRSGALLAKFDTKAEPNTFINDVTIVPNGNAYFTDSLSPILYEIYPDANGQLQFDPWLDFTGTALAYRQGFNLNGIAATDDGKYLIVVQTNTGKLFRIATATKQVSEINVGAEEFTNGDGILLIDHVLHVMRNQNSLLVSVQLSSDYSSGTVISAFTSPAWAYPTTFAFTGDYLLVVNSQFDKRNAPQAPQLPFTVVSVAIPAAATGAPAPSTPVPSLPSPSTPPPGMPTTGNPGNGVEVWVILGVLLLLGGTLLSALPRRSSGQ